MRRPGRPAATGCYSVGVERGARARRTRLWSIIDGYLQHERVAVALIAPADVVFAADCAVQPDLFVVPLVDGRRPEHFDDVRRLLLAVEVLSPSTARADRVQKRALYRREGVPEYWIVDLDARTFERTTPGDDRPEVLVEQVVWAPEGTHEPLVIDLAAYFASFLDA